MEVYESLFQGVPEPIPCNKRKLDIPDGHGTETLLSKLILRCVQVVSLNDRRITDQRQTKGITKEENQKTPHTKGQNEQIDDK